MNRYGLKGFDEAVMAKHIEDGRITRAHLATFPDPMKALGDLMARADMVWAVWPETDKRKPKLLGHGLAIAKGIPLLQRMTETRTSNSLAVITVWFDSHSSACGASELFGDDQEQAA